ncbi:MAG: glutamine synthetase [Candidatus Omnitrophica bacterium]|nr:glutamine synthetase [Candidatus Omnitrophota bacterium]MCA9415124.1 glutamine synthetase [Candidatus Omnitrophota bacterium]MCA9432992.1 glutamine synthetase [Candidatus Omnitrophota bacterium]MCA9434791.1 glutamine synthetase [Candidatus Omnitrophota bacterium]MCA9442719.1 glutamine synthetase [Candidatus Omnitrophota bacterium]
MTLPRDPITIEEIENRIRGGEVDTVVCAFPDHLGRLVGKRVTGSYFLDHVLTHPMHACAYLLTVDTEMTPLPGFELTSWEMGYGDFRMTPDLSTLRYAKWLDKTAILLCDVHNDETGDPVEEAPRNILRNQIEAAGEMGYELYMASELEFYLFGENYRQVRAKGYQNLSPSSDYIIDYHILATTYDEPVIRDIRNYLSASGVPIEFSKGEWGHGQHEINIVYAPALEMADRHVIYKNAVKEIAAHHEMSVSFMAKYSNDAAGNSCHIHTSLADKENKENAFWDADKNEPSQVFRWFLGGLLRAEKDLTLLFAPTINSYKRFEAGSFAPTAIAWSRDNRTCCLRTIGHAGSFRVENRMPGADANPYLAFAATIGAGLWGIKNQVDCGDPFKGDAYQSLELERVPHSLEKAIEVFKESELAQSIFSERVRKFLIQSAEHEVNFYNAAVTDWEKHRYFERI